MVPAPLSTRPQSLPPLLTIKLGPSGAGSQVGRLVLALGLWRSLPQPLLWGWESLLLLPQPPRAFSIRGLRLYFPELEPWVARSALLPSVRPGLSVRKCGASGSASGQTACPVHPTLRQSRSLHGHASPLRPGARLCPSYRSGCMFLFYLLGVGLPSPSDFLSVLVVRGGAVCLPMPPSWFSRKFLKNEDYFLKKVTEWSSCKNILLLLTGVAQWAFFHSQKRKGSMEPERR